MSFRTNAYATVWEIRPMSATLVKARISTNYKNKQTGELETDFSGYVTFNGTGAANKAMSLKEKDRIKLGNVDVTTKYDKDKKVTYTNFRIWDFEIPENNASKPDAKIESASDPEPADGGMPLPY